MIETSKKKLKLTGNLKIVSLLNVVNRTTRSYLDTVFIPSNTGQSWVSVNSTLYSKRSLYLKQEF